MEEAACVESFPSGTTTYCQLLAQLLAMTGDGVGDGERASDIGLGLVLGDVDGAGVGE